MTNKTAWVLGILAAATLAAAATPPDATKARTALRAGPVTLAEIDGDRIVPLRGETALAGFLERGLNGSGDPRVHGTIATASIERDGDRYFLVGRGRSDDNHCLTPTLELTAGTESFETAAAAGGIRFMWIETCYGANCPACLATKDEAGHILFCTCMPAGDCERIVIPVPIIIFI
jgi:hypothetical protein